MNRVLLKENEILKSNLKSSQSAHEEGGMIILCCKSIDTQLDIIGVGGMVGIIPIKYQAHFFYEDIGRNSWDLELVVIQELNEHIKV